MHYNTTYIQCNIYAIYSFCDQQVKLALPQKLRHVVKKYVQPTSASDPIWGYQWNLVNIIENDKIVIPVTVIFY